MAQLSTSKTRLVGVVEGHMFSISRTAFPFSIVFAKTLAFLAFRSEVLVGILHRVVSSRHSGAIKSFAGFLI